MLIITMLIVAMVFVAMLAQTYLVVGVHPEDHSIDQHKLALFIHHNRIGPHCFVGMLDVVEEVQCTHNVVDHPQDLHFLVVQVYCLPQQGRQLVDLLVVVQLQVFRQQPRAGLTLVGVGLTITGVVVGSRCYGLFGLRNPGLLGL